MNQLNNIKFTLITGASHGIGKALAEECAARNMNLILVARSEQALIELAGKLKHKYHIEVLHYIADLTEAGSVKALYHWCKSNNYTVDILINNAGMGLFGNFEKIDIDKQMNLIQLNIESIVQMSYYFLPMLNNQNKAYLLNVASLAALYPLPYYSTYGASKAFVLSFTEALRFEYRNNPIQISCLCPGDTKTKFFEDAGNHNKHGKLMDPTMVAKVGLSELLAGKSVIFPASVKWIARIPKSLLKKIVAKRTTTYF